MEACHKIKSLCILAILYIMALNTYAQNGKYHTVGRGETLASIAKQYGISETDIKNANPTATKVIYVGLKLFIPETNVENSAVLQGQLPSSENGLQFDETTRTSPKLPAPEQSKSKRPVENKRQIKPIDHLSTLSVSAGLSIGSDFSKLVGFNYGMFANVFVNGGMGAYLSLSTNFPFISDSDSDYILKIGPEYKYNISDDFSVGGALCYSLTIAKYYSSKALISGVSIMPYACYSFGNLEFSLSLDTYLRNGHSGLRIGPYFGIGYAF